MKVFRIFLPLLVVSFAVVNVEASVTRYLSGNGADVRPQLFGPVLNLGGGGADVDPAIQWMIDKARGCTDCLAKVDVVVLRATGSNGYNAPILAMNGVDSVETFVITALRDALNPSVNAAIRNAEVVFFAGGDQCDYVTLFARGRIERSVEYVYQRGGAVGGTSAGLAIQGEYVYDGCSGSVTSSQALSDPYHTAISFTYDLFNWTDLSTTITDSHFFQRDRMGRLFSFLARQIKDGRSSAPLGIAISESTSVVVDQNGIATVKGNGNGRAYFVLADHMPEVCLPGSALTYSGFKIWRRTENQTFDLRQRPTVPDYTISVNNGVIAGNPY